MKTLIIVAAAGASLALSLPVPSFAAMAQDQYGPPPGAMAAHDGWSLDQREDWLARRIDRASDNGRLSGNEEQRGRAELDAIRAEHTHLKDRDGGRLSPPDRLYLAHRIDELNRTLRWQGENPPPPWPAS